MIAEKSKKRLQGMLHRHEGALVLEIEQDINSDFEAAVDLNTWVSAGLPKLFTPTSMTDLLESTVAEIRQVTGFDRVLIYKFDSEWHGNVVAEQKVESMPSYLNHRFPASDIPAQARELYTKNLIRVIADTAAVSIPISPAVNPSTGKQLDLTHAVLRSISPVHIEYLINMDVAASMSISLIVRGELWGLIACHHKSARVVNFSTRAICELVGKVSSSLIERIEEQSNTKAQLELQRKHDNMMVKIANSNNISDSLCQRIHDLVSLIDASGAAIVGDCILEVAGTAPDKEILQKIYSWLNDTVQEPVFCSSRLTLDYPQWLGVEGQASGLIAINISSLNRLWIMWFRPEQTEEICWAGNPYKPVEIVENHNILHPRKSFEMWTEIVRGRSRPWTSFERKAAETLQKNVCSLLLAQIIRAEKASNMLRQEHEDMLAIVTHDLTVPVVAMDRVLGFLIADEQNRLPQDIRETLRLLGTANQGQRLRIQKLKQVLGYKIGSNKLNIEEIDLEDLVNKAVKQLIPLPANGPEIVVSIDSQIKHFQSDREALERLIINLLDNAVRAASSSGKVQVSCRNSKDGLTVQITDNGPGINLDDQTQILERFWQGGGSYSYSPQVGMGLVLCKRIVDTLGGTISFESAPGKGTCFSVFLPCQELGKLKR
ncbi:MAG: GAF domain-containing protein [Candidatus Melainabacteria bacterium]|nr:GAF domain-containing protein [Candidatus Melainabacteria bacterium]